MANQRSSAISQGFKLLDIDFIDKKLREPPAKKSRLESYFLGVMEFAEAPPSPTLSDASTSPFDEWSHTPNRKPDREPPSPTSLHSPAQILRPDGSSGSPSAENHLRPAPSRKEHKMRPRKTDSRRHSNSCRTRKTHPPHKVVKAYPNHTMETRSRSRAATRFSRRIESRTSWEKD